MAFTDYDLEGYVYPQDGASSGIDDSDADWLNAVFMGALSSARTQDYAPKGLSIQPDFANNQFDITEGLVYIEDQEPIGYREFTDNEQTRSGTWNQDYLAVLEVGAESGIAFETTTGTNHIYLFFTRSQQNDIKVRVADSTADEPANRALKVGEIDASATESSEKNRNAGLDWQFVNSYETDGDVNTAEIPIADSSYDEYKVKFVGVTGTQSSSNVILEGRANGIATGTYYYRTTQNNTQQSSHFKILQGTPSRMRLGGELIVTTHGRWEYANNVTGNEEKQYSFGGRTTDSDALPFTSLNVFWTSGKISGKWNIWGRNVI